MVRPGEPWIAFQGFNGGRYGILLVRTDGTGRHGPVAMIEGGDQLHPDWSPDGKRLVFSVADGDTRDLWVVDADGGNARRVVDCQAPCAWADEPAWSPDGRSIVFHRAVAGAERAISSLEIFDVQTGSVRIVLTAPPKRTSYQPRWSPDGRSVVLEVVRTDKATMDGAIVGDALAIVDTAAATPAVREITKPEMYAKNPDWSPTGDLIVFAAAAKPGVDPGDGEPGDLYTIHPDGSALTAITSIGASCRIANQPAFTADGKDIIFALTNTPGQEITMAMIHPDGTGLAPATSSGYLPGVHAHLRPTP